MKHQGLLDTTEHATLDSYLVFAGSPSPAGSSRATTQPWCIDSVYLLDARLLRAEQLARGVNLGIASSVTKQQWLNLAGEAARGLQQEQAGCEGGPVAARDASARQGAQERSAEHALRGWRIARQHRARAQQETLEVLVHPPGGIPAEPLRQPPPASACAFACSRSFVSASKDMPSGVISACPDGWTAHTRSTAPSSSSA